MKKRYVVIITVAVLFVGSNLYSYYGNYHGPNSISTKNASSNKILLTAETHPLGIVELKNGDTYDITASYINKIINGKTQRMLAYNGMIPGPTIKVPQGAEINLNFKNNTDIDTSIHSHGVRVDNTSDGIVDVLHKAVKPGESFVYKIKFPDVGVFWYHPHVKEDYEQALGLYGNYIITSNNPKYWSPVNEEVPLTVSDILIEDGKIVPFGSIADHTLMGRFGNVMLVNGKDDYNLSLKQGEVVRFYITNTADTRVFNLAIPGAKIKLVGGDNGKYERETFVDNILISPSERAIVDVLFDSPGTYTLQHKTPAKIYIMGTINVSADPVLNSFKSQFQTLRVNADTIASIDPLRKYFDKKDDKNLTLTIDMGSMGTGGSHQMSNGMMMGNSGSSHMMSDGMMMGNEGMTMGSKDNQKIEWEDTMAMMNSMSNTNNIKWKIVDEDTKMANNNIDWKFKVGDKVKIKIFNDPNSAHPMQHPIHFHGQRFLVLTTNGVKNNNLIWKDTTLIQKGDTVEILVDMENPGLWMAHCHISEHLEDGMAFNFKVN